MFPIVYDTKFLANQPQLDSIVNNSHLCDLFESISKTTCTQIISSNIQFEFPSVHELHDSFSLKFPNYLENGGVFHDAGYDSFCTGYVFTYMMHFLAQQEGKIPDQVESEASEKPLDLAGLASIETDNHFKWIQDITISEYKNKMNMMRSDIGYLSMDGQDHIPDRSKLFYLTGRSWQASDMEKTFGSIGSPYRYYLVEENNAVFLDFAFGPVEDSKSSKELANVLLNISNGSFTVESYSEYALRSNNLRSQVINHKNILHILVFTLFDRLTTTAATKENVFNYLILMSIVITFSFLLGLLREEALLKHNRPLIINKGNYTISLGDCG